MIVTEFAAYRYSLKLKRPVLVKGEKVATRDGIILQIKNADGTSGFGEISPLPGFSRETLIQAEHQLGQLKEEFLTREIPHGLTHLNGHFQSWFKSLSLSPSVRFGAEMAILNLLANAKKVPLGQVIHEHHQPVGHVTLCGLLQGSLDQVVEQAQTLLGLGYRSMKLKVGSQDIHEDAEKVAAVNKITRDKVLLRLDANQAWDFEQALKFGKKIGPASLEYLEEPFKDIQKIPEFFLKTFIPVALDETLQTADFETIKSIEGVDVLVIKPMVLGGLENAWQLFQKARQMALLPVISSCYESALGIVALASMAEEGRHYVAAGLDTFNWFEENLLLQNPSVSNGNLDYRNSPITESNINFRLLQRLQI